MTEESKAWSQLLTAVLDQLLVTCKAVRCQDKDSDSGHDFSHGTILSREIGKTVVIVSICTYCGKVQENEVINLTSVLSLDSTQSNVMGEENL